MLNKREVLGEFKSSDFFKVAKRDVGERNETRILIRVERRRLASVTESV